MGYAVFCRFHLSFALYAANMFMCINVTLWKIKLDVLVQMLPSRLIWQKYFTDVYFSICILLKLPSKNATVRPISQECYFLIFYECIHAYQWCRERGGEDKWIEGTNSATNCTWPLVGTKLGNKINWENAWKINICAHVSCGQYLPFPNHFHSCVQKQMEIEDNTICKHKKIEHR